MKRTINIHVRNVNWEGMPKDETRDIIVWMKRGYKVIARWSDDCRTFITTDGIEQINPASVRAWAYAPELEAKP